MLNYRSSSSLSISIRALSSSYSINSLKFSYLKTKYQLLVIKMLLSFKKQNKYDQFVCVKDIIAFLECRILTNFFSLFLNSSCPSKNSFACLFSVQIACAFLLTALGPFSNSVQSSPTRQAPKPNPETSIKGWPVFLLQPWRRPIRLLAGSVSRLFSAALTAFTKSFTV